MEKDLRQASRRAGHIMKRTQALEFSGRRFYQQAGFRHMPDSFLVYRCPACGKVEFFEFVIEDIECIECGTLIKASQKACPNCGWTWEKADNLSI